MTNETIVAVYDAPEQAEAAAEDLKAAGVAPHAISIHAAGGSMHGDRIAEPPQERGFWTSLFGGEPDHDVDVYQRSLASGSTVLTVLVPQADAGPVLYILNNHHPVDIDERSAAYGLAPASAARQEELYTDAPAAVSNDGGETLQLSEERLSVGKRVVNRGNTRIRRFVVETPVEEQVNLRDETVTVERRPVNGRVAAANAEFTESTVEVQSFGEEAVVGKSAHVVEEVTIGKKVSDRTETIRDTVRREDVEITKVPGSNGALPDRAASPATPVK